MRVIDGDQLIRDLDKTFSSCLVSKGEYHNGFYHNGFKDGANLVRNQILRAQTLEIFSPVRCKDCIDYEKYTDWNQHDGVGVDGYICSRHKKDFGIKGFCNFGKDR